MGDSKLMIFDARTELMAIGTRSKLSQVIPLGPSLVVIYHSVSLLETWFLLRLSTLHERTS